MNARSPCSHACPCTAASTTAARGTSRCPGAWRRHAQPEHRRVARRASRSRERRRRRRGRGRAARVRGVARRRAARARAHPAARSRSCCASTRDELALIDAANCGNPVREMVERRAGRRGADRFLRRTRHRDEGRVDPDGARTSSTSRCASRSASSRASSRSTIRSCSPPASRPRRSPPATRVIVKPPDQAPLSSLRLAELVDGLLPAGVFNVLPGDRDTGAALAAHTDVAMVAIIGSVAAGRAVMRAASDTVKPRAARAGRQERADRVSRRRSGRGRRRRWSPA